MPGPSQSSRTLVCAVEHAAQRPVEELAERVHRRLDRAAQLVAASTATGVTRSSPGSASAAARSARVGLAAGASLGGGAGEVEGRPADDGVLDRGQVAAQDGPDQRDDQRGLASGDLLGVAAPQLGAGVERVEAGRAARVEVQRR